MIQNDRDASFAKIMGDPSMPEDGTAEYDQWLFNNTWQAATERSGERVRVLEEVLQYIQSLANEDAELDSFNMGRIKGTIEHVLKGDSNHR